MIFTLLAAQFGAAQEAIVVYEGAETNHFVDYHPGSNYAWGVYKNFNPDLEADPSEYYFIEPPDSSEVNIHWAKFGMFYLKVTETDATGCTNAKAQAIYVLPNNRLLGFTSPVGNSCFSFIDNSFEVHIDIVDNKGSPLDSIYFPVQVYFTVDNINHSQTVSYNRQSLQVSDDWFSVGMGLDAEISVVMLNAIDRNNASVPLNRDRDSYLYTVFAHPQLQFLTHNPTVNRGTVVTHMVELITGNPKNAGYYWSVIPAEGTSTDLGSIEKDTATIIWDGPPGSYSLEVYPLDGNGCTGDTVIQQIEIIESGDIEISAGVDTVIGSCSPFTLQAYVEKQPGFTYNYFWQPGHNLDDPTSATPVFTPGGTTGFTLTVTNNLGGTAVDSVKITVTDVVAEAGEDVYMYRNETAMLDGTASIGKALRYLWTTNSGEIDSGANTANPIISGFGMYYLEVTDTFGCTASDSVKVTRLTYAPVAVDDYDTTEYKTEVKIAVLDNDSHPEDDIDSLSLRVLRPPFNGTAYVDYDDFTIHYTPNNGFSGNDNFEYQICDFSNNCDNADVYVLVTEYKFLIPNAFSPNGDGINDFFEIIGIEKYEGNSISIFNRWGNEVYKAVNYGISTNPKFWDGKSNTGFLLDDKDLQSGTYYYVLNLGNGAKAIAGSVYLDR